MTSLLHTSASGSWRVLQFLGGRCDGNATLVSMRRALAKLIKVEVRTHQLCLKETTMTHATIALNELDEKGADIGVLRQIDATYVKTREAGRIVSVAVIIAVGVNIEGQREVLGMKVGAAIGTEQNDEGSLHRRYMQLEGLQSLCDTAPTRLSAVAR